MSDYRYVVIGGGMAADAAIYGIRRYDREGEILVLSAEAYPPYKRPPLSKNLWLDQRLEDIWLDGWQKQSGVRLLLHMEVTHIDRARRSVSTQDGCTFQYEKLLIATGGSPHRLRGAQQNLYYPGNVDQHIELWEALKEPRRILVVGGGFIGAEMVAVLSTHHHQVTWIVPEDYPFAGFFPEGLAQYVINQYREHGVEIIVRTTISQSLETKVGVSLQTGNSEVMDADLAVVGIGVQPNDSLWGGQSGLGITVDATLKTDDPSIWAAGDVARMAGEQRPMPHEDHALTEGRMAGMNMAGANKRYSHTPFYYSDLYHFGYEAMGQCTTEYETYEDWSRLYEEGVVYYLDGGRVMGVLNWNVWGGLTKAEELIQSGATYQHQMLQGAIRNQDEPS